MISESRKEEIRNLWEDLKEENGGDVSRFAPEVIYELMERKGVGQEELLEFAKLEHELRKYKLSRN